MRIWLLVLWLPIAMAGSAGAEDEDGGGRALAQNRLAQERSPYLRQHAGNPVDWYPWGPEAFERARTEDRPLLLSVGYAACHWCHVMEHESFEDETVAALLNDAFVCVKVDREERPDVDSLYMKAVQVTSGRGGWPMTVLLTPAGDPFWAGTYLPPDNLTRLAETVQRLWKERRDEVEAQAAQIRERVTQLAAGGGVPPFRGTDADLVRVLLRALADRFDRVHGGYGSRPKFPPHAELLLLLDERGAVGGEVGLDQVRRTLLAMADGGIHDQVGGGFHRYSTDERWLLPHFEKMLYDNALLAQAYAAGAVVWSDGRFDRVCRRILSWVRRDLRRVPGGYASSLDADTEGEEGLTYTWTLEEVRAALSADDAALVVELYGLTEAGNFQDESSGAATGRNVLHVTRSMADLARAREVPVDNLLARLNRIRVRLLEVRAERPQPGLDDKVIVAWNGLLLSAFARCGALLGDAEFIDEGRQLAGFLLGRCRREDGTLLRFPAGSGPEIPGFCEDYVHVIDGLLDLAEATGDARWRREARQLADRLLADFEDEGAGGFWSTSSRTHEALFVRQKEVWDSPIPSDNGTAARVLLRLAAGTDDARYRRAADRTLAAWRSHMAQPRMAPGLTALYRALSIRMRAAEEEGAAPGDALAEDDVLRVDAYVERGEAAPGSRVAVALRVHVAEGWHVHPTDPDDEALVPTSVALEEPAPVRAEAWTWPSAALAAPAEGAAEIRMLAGAFWIRGVLVVPDDAPPGPRRVRMTLRYQPCSGTSCQAPRTLEVDVPLRFATKDGPARHEAIFPR